MIVPVLVEIPKGSRNKYELDKTTNRIKFDRMLFSSVQYPTDYGFILDSLGGDGDPLDACVLVWESTFPGCLIDTKPIGVLKMNDEKGCDEKVLTVPVSDPLWSHLESLEDAPPHLIREIEHFFLSYKELEGKAVEVLGWGDKAEAIEIIEQAYERYKNEK